MKISPLILIIALCLSLISLPTNGQNGLKKGDAVKNIDVKKLLNHSAGITSFSGLQKELTIVDFFGTWCVPCIKALPYLSKIKQQFGNEVSIVLVSNETEAQLAKFLKVRTNISFPIIVDENDEWNTLFQPPSLPYTVVVNRTGKIIAITEAEAITETAIQNWLADTVSVATNKAAAMKKVNNPTIRNVNEKSTNKTVQLSQDYIYAAKTGEPINNISSELNSLDYQTVLTTLSTDKEKKAFWINLYNGYTQAELKTNPEKYKNRNAFFKAKGLQIAGNDFSLDNVEHDLLRRSKIKWSLGHFNKLFPSKKEKSLRVDKLDYRIHFALNCGAKSCPPIAFYNPETLDTQLDLATKAYLTGEAEYDAANNVIKLPALMGWFRADFGGKKGMIRLLKKHGIIPADAAPKIRFKKYDWTLSLNNYST